jgi:hypothetical protein
MPRTHLAVSSLTILTDVQLIHHLNDALRLREAALASAPASRASSLLRRIPLRGPAWYSFVVVGAELVGALEGALLALRLASVARLTAWANRSETRRRSVADDIGILHMLDEMERRVAARGISTHELDPELHRG